MLKQTPRRILMVKPSSLGDIVHALPVLDALNRTFPQAKIDWVVAKGFEALLDHHPMINRLWIIHKDRWKNLRALSQTAAEIRSLFQALRMERFDLVLDLQGLLRSGLITNATKAPVRVGFAEAREGSRLFYTHTVKGGRDIHAVDRYLKIASAIGCDTAPVVFPLPLLKDTDAVSRIKAESDVYAILVPGARWATKRWPAERFAALAAALPVRSMVIGSRADAETGLLIERHSQGKARSLAGKTTLPELISLTRAARLVVTNDSGPMHIAAALGIPTIAIFGPTNPVRTGPYGSSSLVLTPDLPCAPCYKKTSPSPQCLEGIGVDRVLEAFHAMGTLHQLI